MISKNINILSKTKTINKHLVSVTTLYADQWTSSVEIKEDAQALILGLFFCDSFSLE